MLEKVMPVKNYLDIGSIDLLREREYICFVRSVNLRFTEAAGNFAILNLVDKNALPIIGRVFELESKGLSAYELNALKHKAVVVKAVSNQFGNRISLTVNNIREAPANEVDFSLFRGEIPDSSDRVSDYIKFLEDRGVRSRLSVTEATTSYADICGGRVGGYALLMHSVLFSISIYESTNVVDKSIYKFVDCCLLAYREGVRLKESMDVPATAEFLNIIQSACIGIQGVRDRNIAADCCSAVLGLTNPKHLYAHLITKSIRTYIESTSLMYMYPTVMEGSSVQIGEGFLSKY